MIPGRADADTSSALNKFPNAAQRVPNGRPVGPKLQLNAKPLGSVGTQRGPTEPHESISSGFSTPFARDDHRWSHVKHDRDVAGPKDNEVDLTVEQLLPSTTMKARNEVDFVPP